MDNEFIDESINLDGIYEQCNEHLREQDKKRDQLLAFFGAVMGLVVANITALAKVNYIEFIYPFFIIAGWLLSDIMINYMKWHSIYNYSAITLQNLMFFKQKNVHQSMINKLYHRISRNKDFNINYYLRKAETKVFNIYTILSSINLFIYAYILSLKFPYKWFNRVYILCALLITIISIIIMNLKAYRVLNGIFKPKVQDDSLETLSWCLNLYEHEDFLTKLLNEDTEHKYSNDYYEVLISDEKFILKNKNQGAAILPVTQEGKVLLISINRKPINEKVLEIPRGFLKPNEIPLNAAKRELKEETNCDAHEYIDLGCIYPDSGITDSKINLFLAKGCNINNIKLQEKECINGYKLMNIDEVKEQITEGKINDSFTIAAIFRALHHLESK